MDTVRAQELVAQTGRQLLEAQTLAEAGIKDGDVLRLQPEITAGGEM